MFLLIHIFRWFKNLIRFPCQTLDLINKDYLKDRINSKNKKKVLIIGVPKSGTTLIESILDLLGYVNHSRSFFRVFNDKGLSHPHDLSEKMLSSFPELGKTYLKRHSHFSNNNFKLIKKYNYFTIFVFRNLKDLLISRYLHILLWEKHWQHKAIKNLSIIKGFKKSLTYNVGHEQYDIPIIYYSNWIKNWKNKLKNSNYLILNFDDYQNKPDLYLKKIINYLGEEKVNINEIKKKIKKKNLNLNLKKNLFHQLIPNTYNSKSYNYKKKLKNVNINMILKKVKK